MKFQVVTLFPQFIESYLADGVISQALKKKLFEVSILNPRDHTTDIHKSVDDRPFGGGDGMVMMPDILEKTLQARAEKNDHVIYLSPQGKVLNEKKVQELSKIENLTLICGRYGGIDQRVLNQYVDEEISIGDYVLSGGELAALTLMDAVVRKIPGALGHPGSAYSDSFVRGTLEHPLFTRPQAWNDMSVPSVLTSGHHEKIKRWQDQIGKLNTLKKRPELLNLTVNEKKELRDFYQNLTEEEIRVCGLEGLDENL